ncbi:2-hydroxyacyl-CoA dehydratase [Clostridium botulinum]|uniref:Phenyllactate dehydratase n=6 Tax=Clostridium botulinum TaxID=1491 RepID=A0A9Q1ZAJ2_CLOBO|nr:2-hydroxyacyl-CoA dehydratase family protein [Clostridium botulinum]AEB76359.1 R-phenyllactate dehydratase medium subunit, putative [Clostridium botulinum BKT015925]KEI01215.1 phenyllactate dehydratase [Clostridium botulinum D str. 16868]KEI04827.1 phenyllactate dehydratase [Clostridium botulinum C/D str. Sp77]KEI05437.1 phenyllactate dehydratase [Clostridium botulinum C/D str. BKT75002]KEI09389.1 phenyllactate dehydratase [Clostridium botulinum C/D str. BKT2873]
MTDIQNMSAKELLGYYQQKLDEEARQAKKEGKLVCWSASVAPPEFCVAMDIAMVYPETHAAGIGARKGSLDILEVADRKGYSSDICSYARVNLGYMELLKEKALTGKTPEVLANSPAADIPLPDLIITCNNICNTLLKWYENLAVELNIPCIVIDVPFNHTMPIPQYAKDYIADQFKDAIATLEEVCGRKFDYDKFLEVQEQTQRSVAQWNRLAALSSHKPSPLNCFDLFNFMALIVCARSRDYAEITFKKFADELEENLKNGIYAFKGAEKKRITWEGIAVWPYLGHTFKSLKSLGSIMTGSAYPGLWNLTYTPGDMSSMAEAYTRIYINTCLDNKVKVLSDIIEGGKCDGIAYHLNRSCKLMSFLNVETAEKLQEQNGLPYVSFDGDQTDPRNFAPAQFDTRVQALAEMMDQSEEGK